MVAGGWEMGYGGVEIAAEMRGGKQRWLANGRVMEMKGEG